MLRVVIHALKQQAEAAAAATPHAPEPAEKKAKLKQAS
jgi:hypothetical protein